MCSSGFFLHRLFHPGPGRSSPWARDKRTTSSTEPYGNQLRRHLAIDTDPMTPTLKRFTNFRSVETETQFLCDNISDVKLRPKTTGNQNPRDLGANNFASFSSSTTSCSNSPSPRPQNWTLTDGNWTLRKNKNTRLGLDSGFSGSVTTGTFQVIFPLENYFNFEIRAL